MIYRLSTDFIECVYTFMLAYAGFCLATGKIDLQQNPWPFRTDQALSCSLLSALFLWYRIYPKYSDTSTPYHICSKIWTNTIHYPMLCLKIAGWVANSVDPDETPRSAAYHLGLYCLLRPVCPNTYGKYGIILSATFKIVAADTLN